MMSGEDKALASNGRHYGTAWLAAALVIVVLMGVALGWWWMRVHSSAPDEPAQGHGEEVAVGQVQRSIPEPVDPNGAQIARRAGSSNPAAFSGPHRDNQRKPFIVDNATPTAEAIKILLPLAEAGHADAMNEIAVKLVRCSSFVGSDEVTIRRNVLREFYSRNGHEPESDDELSIVATWINEATPMLELCRGLDPGLMAKRIDWMERAARGGDIAALLNYGSNALNDMRGREDILMNFDEVARRRQLAGSFLQAALDRGACVALINFSVAYSGRNGFYDWLFKSDAYLSLVYAEAALRAGVITTLPPEVFAAVPDPARQAAAAAQGAALAARHCDTPG